jgi:hypothetical protein
LRKSSASRIHVGSHAESHARNWSKRIVSHDLNLKGQGNVKKKRSLESGTRKFSAPVPGPESAASFALQLRLAGWITSVGSFAAGVRRDAVR